MRRDAAAQHTTFNTLDNWGYKTPTQSERKRTGKKRLKCHGPEHVYNTLSYIDIKYRPGNCNADVDALSRLPGQRREQSTGGSQHITSESVKAVCNSSQTESYGYFSPAGSEFGRCDRHGIKESTAIRYRSQCVLKAVSSGRKPPMEALTSSPAQRTLQ